MIHTDKNDNLRWMHYMVISLELALLLFCGCKHETILISNARCSIGVSQENILLTPSDGPVFQMFFYQNCLPTLTLLAWKYGKTLEILNEKTQFKCFCNVEMYSYVAG